MKLSKSGQSEMPRSSTERLPMQNSRSCTRKIVVQAREAGGKTLRDTNRVKLERRTRVLGVGELA